MSDETNANEESKIVETPTEVVAETATPIEEPKVDSVQPEAVQGDVDESVQVELAPDPVSTSAKSTSSDDKTMGILAHILGIFVGILGALIIWIIKKDESPYVKEEATEALNFQISLILYYVAFGFITVILTFITAGLFGIVSPLIYGAIYIFSLVVMIMASIEANKSGGYKYPLCIRFIK